MGRTIGSLYFFFWGGEGCVSLLLFVTEAHWRRRNQKQNRNRNKTTSPSSPSSRLVKISPPQRPAQSPVLQASQKIFFFEELKTRNLVKIIWKCMLILMILRPQKIEVVVVGSGHASRDNRGPIDSFLKRSPKTSRFLEIS